jgi:hypothetical protein
MGLIHWRYEKMNTLQRKVYATTDFNFTPGERAAVSFITSDEVDHEGDVVIPAGVDWKSVWLRNPVVLASHNFQAWPVARGEWIRVAKGDGFTGLLGKAIFDDDEEAQKLFGKVQRGIVRGQSIGFKAPDDMRPGEWGPPTFEELKRRPDWKGAKRVIRRCVLLEWSFVGIQMNSSSLVCAVSKGLQLETKGFRGGSMDPTRARDEMKLRVYSFVLEALAPLRRQAEADTRAELARRAERHRLDHPYNGIRDGVPGHLARRRGG